MTVETKEKKRKGGGPKGHPPYPGCETGGRPPIYTPEVIEGWAEKFKEWLKDERHFWLKDFALDNDFHPDYLSEWAAKNEKFRRVYEIAKERQQSRLVNGAITNTYNPSFTKFVLNVHHDWIEKKQTIHTNDPDSPVPNWIMATSGDTKDLVNDESEC